MSSHAYVSHPTLVYVLVDERSDFDSLAAPCTDHGVGEHGGHVLTKAVDNGSVKVVFQFWLKDPDRSGDRSQSAT